MWRRDGKIVQYIYHPDQQGDFGQDFEWKKDGKPCHFEPGKWHCVETHVRMNKLGKKDGLVESWLDGARVLKITDLRFRDTDALQIDGLAFSTFFGGGDASWAPATDQFAEFDDFVIADRKIGRMR